MSKIAFVGVGRMGANMARHLQLDCGHEITGVFDVDAELAREVATELGAQCCDSLAEVTSLAEIVFTVISDDVAMRAIFLDPSDSLLKGAEGKTFINCATLTPAVHQEVAKAAGEVGAKVLEGAMASSISQAREGSLFLMVGGDEAVFNEHRTLLDELSIQLKYCGEMGKAAEVKALVNMVMNMNTAALAEGLGLADALGLDLKMVCEVFSQTGAASRVLETDAEDMIERDHECWFSGEHAAKDSGIAAQLADSAGLSLPVNRATFLQYQKMVEQNLGHFDKSGVAELTFKGRISSHLG